MLRGQPRPSSHRQGTLVGAGSTTAVQQQGPWPSASCAEKMERIFEAPRSNAQASADKVRRAKPDEAAERVSALVAEMKVLEALFAKSEAEEKAPEAPAAKKAKLGPGEATDLRDVSRPARPSQKASKVTPRSCATPKPSQKVPKISVSEEPLAKTVRPTTKLSTQAATASWQRQDANSLVEPGEPEAEEPEAEEPPEPSDAKQKDFRDWLQRLDLGHKGTLMRYFNALKEQFDCDLKLLKCTQLAREVREDQSVVDIIEPNLWTSCNIEKRLHKLILAKGIFALD